MDSNSAIPVPYTSRLLSKVAAGQTLVIQGQSPSADGGGKRFEVNLLADCTGIDPNRGAVLLHVSVRFDEGKLVLNNFHGGTWGKEERHGNPFKAGEPFDLRIRVHDDRYEISAQQKHCCDFKHRQPFDTIDHLQVDGEVQLRAVHWGGRYFQMPFEAPFYGGHLRPGQRVHVHGVPGGADFSVNFVDRSGNMVFHFNTRFSEKAVLRNAQTSAAEGGWGNEEREGKFVFQKKTGFDLVIHNEPYSIQVFVNGDRFCSFAHRVDPSSAYTGLRVEGDVDVTGVEVSH